jgi:hypothetical protein
VKSVAHLFLSLFFLVSTSHSQTQSKPAQPPVRTDVYHVHITTAAPGKSVALADFLKKPNPAAAMPDHFVVLRHQYGDSWDYVVIQHMGNKATVEAAGNPPPAAARDASVLHTDTFVNGPPWPEFARALGLGDQASKTRGSVYVVSLYRAAAGHRDQLEKELSNPPGPGQTVAAAVLLQHLEGASWNYLSILRYNSWDDLATNEKNAMAVLQKNQGGWFTLRDHTAFHTDTITDRIAP